MATRAHVALVEVEVATAKRFDRQLRQQFRTVHGRPMDDALDAFFERMADKILSDHPGETLEASPDPS